MHHADRNAHATRYSCADTSRPLPAPRRCWLARLIRRLHL